MIELDGSVLEGGGQILRNAIAYSSLLNEPITITNIRSNRPKGGLRPQHLTGIQLGSEITSAELSGCELGSCRVTYRPDASKAYSKTVYNADTETAGSITLLLQSVLPILLFPTQQRTSMKLNLIGGTDTSHAPPLDFYRYIFVEWISKFMGIHVEIPRETTIRGFYPKGKGSISAIVHPFAPGQKLPSVKLTSRGTVTRITGKIFIAGAIQMHVADRIRQSAMKLLSSSPLTRSLPCDIEIVQETAESAFGNGCGITLFVSTTSGTVLSSSSSGEQGKKAEKVGSEAAQQLIDVLAVDDIVVDEYLQDQVIILLALADGESELLIGKPSLHTRTAIYVAEKLMGAVFSLEPVDGSEESATKWRLKCRGVGFCR